MINASEHLLIVALTTMTLNWCIRTVHVISCSAWNWLHLALATL